MLSKLLGSLVVVGFLVGSSPANAHATHINVKASATPIVISWTWMAGHFIYPGVWVRGHWSHPVHGKSHRAHRHGPPPAHARHPVKKHRHQPRHYRRR
jgi:hypothetical protein